MEKQYRPDRVKINMKIFHGPANIAGIGGYLSSWQRKKGYISDFVTYNDATMRQNHDLNLHLNDYNRFSKILILFVFFILCIFKYNIFHFYFGRTFLPFGLDLPILKFFRKKIIMTYCGSDIRLINDVEKKRNPYFYLLNSGLDSAKYDNRKKRMMRWQNLWVDQFFTVRSLYPYATFIIPRYKIINDIWMHNTMDMDAFYPSFITKDIPTLIHAPSDPLIKGTKHVEDVIQLLKAEGYKFKYIRLEKIPNDEAQRVYREEADIIIDQFYIPGLGSLAIEGMYYGKPVCTFTLEEFIRDYYPDCPVVNCKIDNLKEKLVWLIKHPEERIRLGKRGRVFVEKYCDREKINQKVLEVYNKLINT